MRDSAYSCSSVTIGCCLCSCCLSCLVLFGGGGKFGVVVCLVCSKKGHGDNGGGHVGYRQHQGIDRPGVRKSQRAVENREKWRKLVAKSSVVPHRPSRLRD